MPGKRLDESKRECVRKLHEYFQKELANGGPLLPLNAIQEVDKKKYKDEAAMTLRHVKSPPLIEPIERIVLTNPCPLCVEHEQVSDVIDVLQIALTKEEIQEKLDKKIEQDGETDKLHNVSACHLPKSRQIIQKRYQ